jgi:hypothetical protein
MYSAARTGEDFIGSDYHQQKEMIQTFDAHSDGCVLWRSEVHGF